jgi:hypothetical protein
MVEDFQETFGFDYRNGLPKDFAPCGKERAYGGGGEEGVSIPW